MQLTLPSGYIFEQYELRLHSDVQNRLHFNRKKKLSQCSNNFSIFCFVCSQKLQYVRVETETNLSLGLVQLN